MRTRRLCNAFFLPLLLTLLASCSGTGSSLDVASFVTEASSSKWRAEEAQTSLSYRPDPDGFSFGNYQMTDPASFTINDAAALLKDAVCTKDVSGCVPSASAVEWVETVRAALQGGLCEGFSLLSMSSYLSQEAATASVFSLSKSKATERALSQLFATQFMPEVRTAARSWRSRTLEEIVKELQSALSSESEMYTIGLYSTSGGHAVVPYAVQEITPGMFVISVYDSNWPGRDRFLEINTNNDTWRFSYKAENQVTDTEAWSGKSGSMDITPFSARTAKFSAPFDATDQTSTMTLTVRADDTTWSVTQAGKILASSLTESTGDEVRGAFGVRTILLRVPDGSLQVKLPGGPTNTAARVSVTTGLTSVSVKAASSDVAVEFDVGTNLKAKVTGEASVSTVAAQSRTKLLSSNTAEVTAFANGATTTHTIDSAGVANDASLTASLTRRDAVVVLDKIEVSTPKAVALPARTLSENLPVRDKIDTKPTTSVGDGFASTTTSPATPDSSSPRTTSITTISSTRVTVPTSVPAPRTTRPLPPPTTKKPQPQDCRAIEPASGLDTDKDGLSDELELCVRTDPQRRDMDGDGLTDADEVLACLYPKPGPAKCSNPTKPDSDSDGMRDDEEVRLGTNPNVNDTDQDGIPDGVELANGLDPLRRDSNNDGIPDSL